MSRPILLALFLLLLGRAASAQQYPIMADVLAQNSVPVPPPSIPHLNSPITSFATLNDAREFVIAYYLADPSGKGLLPPLLITRFEKASGRWQHLAIDVSQIEGSGGSIDCLGAVVELEKHASLYYLSLHLNPSAECTVIMDNAFRTSDVLEGWPVAWVEGVDVLYIGNMIHFSDVHPEVLWLYDPGTHKRTQIYPQPQDPFRSAYSARLAQAVNEEGCRQRNWACDPGRFTSDIGTVTVDDATASFAFPVKFEPEGFLDWDEAQNSGKWDDDDYVYIYQLNPLRWRAFSIYDLKPKFGTDSLKTLLMPDHIEKVFATSAPK